MLGHAVKLADAEGLEAVTIRRLAQELGVTPMALYWHFKNKDELVVGMLDAVFGQVTADVDPGEPWQRRLRVMIEALTDVLRGHPWVAAIPEDAAKFGSENFLRATDTALGVLAEGGYDVQRGFQICIHLLCGVTDLVAAQPRGAPELRHGKRLELEAAALGRFPLLERYARSIEAEPDLDAYYEFGLDLLLSGVERLAPGER